MTSYMGLFSARPGLPGSSRDGLRSVKALGYPLDISH